MSVGWLLRLSDDISAKWMMKRCFPTYKVSCLGLIAIEVAAQINFYPLKQRVSSSNTAPSLVFLNDWLGSNKKHVYSKHQPQFLLSEKKSAQMFLED